MIVFIILRSDDAGCLLIRATIDADIANGDVSRSGGTGEGNLVFSPAISDVEGKNSCTSSLNCCPRIQLASAIALSIVKSSNHHQRKISAVQL